MPNPTLACEICGKGYPEVTNLYRIVLGTGRQVRVCLHCTTVRLEEVLSEAHG